MKRHFIVLAAVLVVGALFAGCAEPASPSPSPSPSAPAEKDWAALGFLADAPRPIEGVQMPKSLRIGAGSAPGDMGDLTGKWVARRIEEGYPEMASRVFPASVRETPKMMAAGDIDLAQGGALMTYPCYTGKTEGCAEGGDKIRNLFAAGGTYFFVYATKDSGITDVSQLKDKNIGIRPDTSVSHKLAKLALEPYGITFDSITANGGLVFIGSTSEIATKMIEGTLDATLYIQNHPEASALMVAERKGIVLLPLKEESLQAIEDAYFGVVEGKIGAGTYPGQTEDYEAANMPSVWITTTDMADDVVYNMLAWMFKDGGESFQQIVPGYQGFDPIVNCLDGTLAAGGVMTPLHPGAAKYYRAWGITIPDDAAKG